MSDDEMLRAADAIARRADESFKAQQRTVYLRTDRLFFWLLLAQWALAIVLSIVASPLAWEGRDSTLHPHVYVALGFGGLITLLPLALIKLRPGEAITRHVVTIGMCLWSAMLIHLLGGRIEAHFTLFMGVTFIAFYRDWKLLITSLIVTGSDHVLRALSWPESLFGSANGAIWRMVEHAAWIQYGVFVLYLHLRASVKDMRATAEANAQVEALAEGEWRRSSVLDRTSSVESK